MDRGIERISKLPYCIFRVNGKSRSHKYIFLRCPENCSVPNRAKKAGTLLQTECPLKMAPRAGLEPATLRLTAECSTIELPRNSITSFFSSYSLSYCFSFCKPQCFSLPFAESEIIYNGRNRTMQPFFKPEEKPGSCRPDQATVPLRSSSSLQGQSSQSLSAFRIPLYPSSRPLQSREHFSG